MRINNILLITSFVISSLFLFISPTSNAAVDKRWFEIEVILFSQLKSDADVNEQFTETPTLPKHRKVIDLLTPYLYPKTSDLRLQLASCTTGTFVQPYLIENSQVPLLHQEKSLEDITQLMTDDIKKNTSDQLGQYATHQEIAPPNDTNDTREHKELTTQNNIENTNQIGLNEYDNINQTSIDTEPNATNNSDNERTTINTKLNVSLTTKQIALVEQAQATLGEYSLTTQPFSHLSATNKTLCQDIPNTISDYIQLSEHAKTDIPPYPVNQLAGHVNGNEFIYSDQPYLIGSESLQLKDIWLQLKRSKNFRPLLHLGWRQSLINRLPAKKAAAFRIFAGDHFQQDYLTKLKAYHTAKTAYEHKLYQQQMIDTQIETEENLVDSIEQSTQPTIAQHNKLAHINYKLSEIYSALNSDNIDYSTNTLINELELPSIDTNKFKQLEVNNTKPTIGPFSLKPPQKPLQPWFLDGYFRVHLNHYLYITADFTMANQNLATQETFALTRSDTDKTTDSEYSYQLIPFSQNKRVISKEVHYFDHPYMGMIVQIRRYKKPEPPELDDSEELDN